MARIVCERYHDHFILQQGAAAGELDYRGENTVKDAVKWRVDFTMTPLVFVAV